MTHDISVQYGKKPDKKSRQLFNHISLVLNIIKNIKKIETYANRKKNLKHTENM